MLLLAHVLAAFGIVAALTVEWIGHALLARGSRSEGMAILAKLPYVGAPSGIALLASGFWLAGTQWGWGVPWIDVAIGSMVAMALAGGLITGRTMAGLKGEAPGPEQERWLVASLRLRTGIVAGVAALMVLKPALPVALAVVLVGAAFGLVPARRVAVLP